MRRWIRYTPAAAAAAGVFVTLRGQSCLETAATSTVGDGAGTMVTVYYLRRGG